MWPFRIARAAPEAAKAEPARAKATNLAVLARLLERGSATEAGYDVNETTAMAVPTVMACVQLIANDVATLPLKVRRAAGGRMQDASDVPEMSLLFRKPNAWQTSFEFRQMMTLQAILRGNAYAYKVRSSGRARVGELWPLMASEVQVRREGARIIYGVSAYDGAISGDYGRDRIMHLRNMTWDGMTGLDRMKTARDGIGLAGAAQNTQGNAFKNGVRMPGYWSTDEKLSPDAVDQLTAALSNGDKWRSPVLDAGLQWKTTAQNFDDAELLDTRRHQMVEICAAFGVVPAVLGIDDKTQAFASVEAMMRWHLQHTLRPWLTAWEQAIDRDVLDGAEGPLFAKFDTSDMEKASTAERADSYRNLVELGVMTRNEARELEGLPPLPGLDEPLTPLNMQGGQQGDGGDQ